jgi:hypothetical protein
MMDFESTKEAITLLDLIHVVQDESENDREVVATLSHLLDPRRDRSKRRASR